MGNDNLLLPIVSKVTVHKKQLMAITATVRDLNFELQAAFFWTIYQIISHVYLLGVFV